MNARGLRAAWILCWCAAAPLAQESASARQPEDAGAALPPGAPDGMQWIDRADLARHAQYLASDELGGRYTSSAGQRKAAEYMAAQLAELGVQPLGDLEKGQRGWFQSYPLEATYLDPAHTAVRFAQREMRGGFAVVQGKNQGVVAAKGRFLFCGNGDKDDLPAGNYARRIPVVVLDDRATGPRAQLRGIVTTQRAAAINRELAKRGAKVVLFALPQPAGGLADSFNYSALLPDKPLLRFGHESGRAVPPHTVPSLFLGQPLTTALFEQLGVTVDKSGGYRIDDKALDGEVEVAVATDKGASAVNVCGYVEGSDKALRGEAVVFSAHMDHMGTRLDGDTFNGADDNASGTSALLEIAQAFAKGARPRRSVVFLSVSGEEEGLWGSSYYSDQPTWPIAKIVADVNIDMIGRNTDLAGSDAISVTPSFQHAEYSTMVRTAAELGRLFDLSLTSGDRYYERSDHYNFARKNVPVVFFCDGEHADYHKVSDHADKLDYSKMERVARLAYWTGYQVADTQGRPKRLGSQPSW